MSAPGLFDAVLARGGARAATDDAAWLRALLDVEAALAGACADAGVLDPAVAAAVARACRGEGPGAAVPDVARLGADAAAAGNPVVPLVAALRAGLRDAGADEAAGAVHHGATSQDVLDTAAMLVVDRTRSVLLADLRAAADAAAQLARSHRDVPAAGRTLLQQAAPTTVGLRAAGWAHGLDLAADALAALCPAVQLGGAVGTLAAYEGAGRSVRSALAGRLGLAEPVLAWHTERGRIAEIASVLGRVGAAVGGVATDLVLLAQTEVAEVREDVPGRGGSSAMPHKRNPVGAVSARAAAMAVPGLVAALLSAASGHEYERAAGAWHAEWRPLGELLRTVGSGAAWLADALSHLVVDPAAVAAGLDATGGLLLAEHATTALRRRLGAGPARDLVTTAAARALDEGRPFAEVLAAGLAEAGAGVSRAEVDAMLDPGAHTGDAAALVDDALAHRARRTPDPTVEDA